MVELKTSPVSDTANRKRRLIMVVDSDADNLVYTSTILKRFDYPTDTAKTAKEALDRAAATAPSLIITALGLNDMHGLDLMRNLKKDPGTAAVPVIALRRQGDLQGEKCSLELGACDCLYQPVAPEKLYLAVQSATETRPRKNIRLKTTMPVKVDGLPVTDSKSTYASDLSERGMFLQCAEPAAVNTRLSLQIDLNGHSIPVQAAVVYSYRTPGGSYLQPGMGLEFNRIAPNDQELIRRYVRNEITRGIAPGNA